jgi:hypothetical protein
MTTSLRRVQANRSNARASSGPKTIAGKARSARNARRHGLTVPVWAVPQLSAEAETLALELAGADADRELTVRARAVAEAELDLLRVRRARFEMLAEAWDDPICVPLRQVAALRRVRALIQYERSLSSDEYLPWSIRRAARGPEGAEKFALILSNASHALTALDRYEKRALSRRKFAIRAFDDARLERLRNTDSSS